MKSSSIAQSLAFLAAITASESLARPAMYRRNDGADQCTASTSKALLKYIDNGDNSRVQGIVLAEGTLSVSGNEEGNTAINVEFFDCDSFGYTQGSSRNSGGSMGAPLEYFGQVRQESGTGSTPYCLTATPSDPSLFRFQPCSFADDDTQLQQLFTRQIEANGDQLVGFIGQKNTTSTPYNGPKSWTLGQSHGAFPPAIEATSTFNNAALKLQL